MDSYQTFLSTIKNNHLFFFTVVLILLELISDLLKPYSIDIYSPITILTLYFFINESISIFQLILASFISTIVPYVVCRLFKVNSKSNVLILHIGLIFSVLTLMTMFNCVFIPGVAHALTSYKMLPQNSFSFLCSYISAVLVIILLCMGLFFIFTHLSKADKKILSQITNLQQLEKNIKL
uniref:Uncharacterized protein n=1 Tax=viral metagenome TaxID=1070528 RepID=A0A6C0HRN0_9ZZZZ